MGLYCGIIFWHHITESYYGIILRNRITESYYGIILLKYIKELYLRKGSRGSLGSPRSPRGHPGTPRARPWDPRGRPWDPWACPWNPPGAPLAYTGPPGAPTDHKAAIFQQIASARSFRLLHPNPFVATHHSEDPLDRFIMHTTRTEPLSPPPPAPGLRTGFTPMPYQLVPWLYIY